MSTSQRVSRGFHRLALFLSVLTMPLVADSPSLADTKQIHAACELKALELYKSKASSTEWEAEQAYYVEICMEAHGYKMEEHPLASSDNTRRQDHAACKLKALELYKSKVADAEFEDEQGHYLKICMEAHGYKERSSECGKAAARWMLDDCFQRE